MKIYKVGGYVRDLILGISPRDCDYVVVGTTPDYMKSRGFIQVGKHFPVFLHPQTGEEYALARREIKTGPKHTDFQFIFDTSITLKEDLMRRDFTCNALALDIDTNKILDYIGGYKDIQNKILRHINAEHFIEDPLRVLRLCRFAAQLDFTPASETLQLCQEMVAKGMLGFLSAERIWQEFYKAMKTPRFDRFIEVARATGALEYLMPEVEKMWQTPENTDYHPEGTTGGHVISALKVLPKAPPLVKFGILLHDIGKIKTPKNELPHHYRHAQYAKSIISNLCERLRVPNEFCDFAQLAASKHMLFSHILELKGGKLFNLAAAMTVKQHFYFKEYVNVCRADYFSVPRSDLDAEKDKFGKRARLLYFYCRQICAIKATDMPNFERMVKGKNFHLELRAFKIKTIKERLKLAENNQTPDFKIENE